MATAEAAFAPPTAAVTMLLPQLVGGGLERVMTLLGAELARRGEAVEFLLCGADARPDAAPPGTSARVLSRESAGRARLALARRGAPGALWPGVLPAQVGAVHALEEYLRTARPRALIAAALTPNIIAAHARRATGVRTRVVLTLHNTLSAQLRELHRDAPLKYAGKRVAFPGVLRRALLAADAVVAVSQGVADDAAATLGLPPGRITVIYNPVVDEALLAAAVAPCPHPWLGPGAPPVLVGFGRLVPRKRFDLLIDAHARLRPNLRQRLILLGEGSERDALETLARTRGVADSVHFAGRVENPYAYLSRAAAMAMCSQYEGFGLVIAEALVCGCPVVSTDCPYGPAEILDRGRYGTLVPVDEVSALTDAIAGTLAAPPDRQALRARGLAFSVATAADRYVALLREGSP